MIRRYTAEGHRFRLCVSLNAAIPWKRAALMPVVEQGFPLDELIEAIREHAARRGRVTVEYVMIDGVNIGPEDAAALGEILRGIAIRLNPIAVNDARGRYRPPDEAGWNSFRDALARELPGQPIVRRYSGGQDKLAACGMLASSRTAEERLGPHSFFLALPLPGGSGSSPVSMMSRSLSISISSRSSRFSITFASSSEAGEFFLWASGSPPVSGGGWGRGGAGWTASRATRTTPIRSDEVQGEDALRYGLTPAKEVAGEERVPLGTEGQPACHLPARLEVHLHPVVLAAEGTRNGRLQPGCLGPQNPALGRLESKVYHGCDHAAPIHPWCIGLAVGVGFRQTTLEEELVSVT